MTLQHEPEKKSDFCPDGLGNPTRVGDLIALTDEFLPPHLSSHVVREHVGEIGVVVGIPVLLGGIRWVEQHDGVSALQRVEARLNFGKIANLTIYADEFIRISDDHTQELRESAGSDHSGVLSGAGIGSCE